MAPSTMGDDTSKPLSDPTLYQALVGVLNYVATGSRPDICYAVHILSTKAHSPTLADLNRAKKCLIYLRDTKNLSLYYRNKRHAKFELEMYVDASFATGSNRRSIYGYVIYLNRTILLYKAKTQPLVTLSSTESEFVGVALSLKDMMWTRNLLTEMKVTLATSVVYCDNQGALKILSNNSSTGRTKNLDTKLQFAKEQFGDKKFIARYVETSDQIADIFTKPLNRLAFEKLRHELLQEYIAPGAREGVRQ